MEYKNIKIITCIILFITIISFVPILSHASWLDDIISDADSFLKKDPDRGTVETVDGVELEETSKSIFNALMVVGTIISFAYGLFLGMKYMLSSVDDKVDVKKALIPFVIGVIVLYGAYGIWLVVIKIGVAMNQISVN